MWHNSYYFTTNHTNSLNSPICSNLGEKSVDFMLSQVSRWLLPPFKPRFSAGVSDYAKWSLYCTYSQNIHRSLEVIQFIVRTFTRRGGWECTPPRSDAEWVKLVDNQYRNHTEIAYFSWCRLNKNKPLRKAAQNNQKYTISLLWRFYFTLITIVQRWTAKQTPLTTAWIHWTHRASSIRYIPNSIRFGCIWINTYFKWIVMPR